MLAHIGDEQLELEAVADGTRGLESLLEFLDSQTTLGHRIAQYLDGVLALGVRGTQVRRLLRRPRPPPTGCAEFQGVLADSARGRNGDDGSLISCRS